MMSRGSYRDRELDGMTTTSKESGEPDEELQFRDGALAASGIAPSGSSSQQAVLIARQADPLQLAANTRPPDSAARPNPAPRPIAATAKLQAAARPDATRQPASSPKKQLDELATPVETTAALLARSRRVRERSARLLAAHQTEPRTQPATQAPDWAAGLSPEAATAQPAFTHVVQSGESLWSLSRRYKVNISALKASNDLRNDLLRPGDRLRIPRGD